MDKEGFAKYIVVAVNETMSISRVVCESDKEDGPGGILQKLVDVQTLSPGYHYQVYEQKKFKKPRY